jgi:DNA-binding winged helix-turn-helix (wHTH) protein/tetratricopeptide (TPR) repeat protein
MTGGISESATVAWIDLRRAGEFRVGAASVRPKLREVVFDGRTIKVQPRVMQVLVALANAHGEVVSRDDLVDACWGRRAVSEDAINRCIQKLRRLAETELGGAFAIETLFGVGYRLSWQDVAAPERQSLQQRGRRWRSFALVVAGLLVSGVAAWLVLSHAGPQSAPRGIALAPFQSADADPLARGVAQSLTDAVSGRLAAAGLKVAALGSSGGVEEAQRRGAVLLLGGLVRADERNVDLDVRAEDARSQAVLWASTVSRPRILQQALQEQVAVKLADVLRCALNERNFQGGRPEEQTLRLLLQACDRWHDPGAQDTVRDLLKRVTVREPGAAAAWSSLALADAAAAMALPSDDPLPAAQTASFAKEARAAAGTALRLDPTDGNAYVALADLEPANGAFAARQQYLSRGLALQADNALLNDREAELLFRIGRLDEGIAFANRAVNLDPLSPDLSVDLAVGLANGGYMAGAREQIERAVRVWPDFARASRIRIAIEARLGDPDRALALLAEANAPRSAYEREDLDEWRNLALTRKGREPARVEAFVRETLKEFDAGQRYASNAMLMLENVGAVNDVFALAARATPADPVDPEVLFRPFADGVRRDPRFMPLAAKLGVVDYWRTSGKWPDFCSAPHPPYDCRAQAGALSYRR